MKKFILLVSLCSLGFCHNICSQDIQPVPSVPYEWKSVPIVGGGFVDGIVFHPTQPDVRYCRTDMGGAYRWNPVTKTWTPLLDWITLEESNLQGVESIAIDPQNPDNVYLACGTYTSNPLSVILYSYDGGKTFARVDVPFTMGGNENGRGNGERMMVDPLNGNILYMGTRLHGLWRSMDKGQSWHKVTSFPDVTEAFNPQDRSSWMNRGSGIVCVVFAPDATQDEQGTRDIYVAVSLKDRESLFVSHDYGNTWQPVEGQPIQYRPTSLSISNNKELVLTYGDTPGPSTMKDGGVWKYDIAKNKWTDISPIRIKKGEKAGFGYISSSIDPNNPKHMIVSTHHLDGKHGYTSDEMFRTTDGGKHWKPIFKTGFRYDHSKAPYTQVAPLHWMFDIEINPGNPEHAIFTTGFGGWETFNLSGVERKEPVVWSIMSSGIEETVPLELYAPEKGARIISGVGDYGGFTHFRPDELTDGSHSNPHFANTNGVTGAWLKQELIVRVGALFGKQPGAKTISYSEDGGMNWIQCASLPDAQARNGHIAVAADGSTWIWTPDRMDAYYTCDKGATWQLCKGLPKDMRVIADKMNARKFYAVDAVKEILYVSEDGGKTFQSDTLNLTMKPYRRPGATDRMPNRGDRRGGQDRIYSTPGFENDLWIAAYDGLYHSKEAQGVNFKPLDKVRKIYAFGFGKAKPGTDYPALYLIGVVNGQYGFFRSDDEARSWVRINDDAHQYGLVLHIIGDMQEYGRVYVGTHGRGLITGAPKP